MARCPFAEWVPVALRSTQKRIRPAGLVAHTAVSNSPLLKPSGEIRWHFYNNRAGELYQFFDTEVSAACQRDGNYWTENGVGWGFVSCESWDGAYTTVWPDPDDTDSIPPWTDAQMETWARLGAWLHEEHGVPLVKATGVRGRGIGWHSQYTAPDGQLRWNKSHACPAKARIAQMPLMIRMMNDALEDDMPITDADAAKIAKATWEYRLNPGEFADRIGGYTPDATYPAGGLLVGGDAYGRELHNVLPTILAGIAKLGEPGLSDEERRALAADVAGQVNQWRVVMERVESQS